MHIFFVMALLVFGGSYFSESFLVAHEFAQECDAEKSHHHHHNDHDHQVLSGITTVGNHGFSQTSAEITAQQINFVRSGAAPLVHVDMDRQGNAQHVDSTAVAHHPVIHKSFDREDEHQDDQELMFYRNPQAIGVNFTGLTLPEVNLFPPDSMGAVGPSQFIVACNGRIRSFSKVTGHVDGAIDVNTDIFFSAVANGTFTSDPRIRYDRLSGRWFIVMINVPTNFDNNRIMIAVSNNATITTSTIWTFFHFNAGVGNFLDYPTLGIDVNALYIGGQTFSNTNTGQVFVVRKSSILGAGPIVVTTFNNIINVNTGSGPYVPQGVDNFDTNATTGNFIAVDNLLFGKLVLRRIFNPGGIPTMSADIPIIVPTTQFPLLVPHRGNNNGVAGQLDSIDDRLFMAQIRNGQLWTAHNIGVNNNGVSSSTSPRTRNGCRWYEIDTTKTSPLLVQAGTLFAASANNTTDQRSYWIPSVMISGQGHMALGCSTAGQNEFVNAAVAGRLSTDPLGTIQSATLYTASTTAYNPSGDPGDAQRGRRWGDFSYVSIDPCDDMTMWTIQEFCNATNSWGVRVVKLLAPAPATPLSATPSSIQRNQSSVDILVTGASKNGTGFFDPGLGFGCRLGATVSGGVTVKNVTYINSTTVKITISTVGTSTGSKNVTIINPDGQSIVANNFITIT